MSSCASYNTRGQRKRNKTKHLKSGFSHKKLSKSKLNREATTSLEKLNEVKAKSPHHKRTLKPSLSLAEWNEKSEFYKKLHSAVDKIDDYIYYFKMYDTLSNDDGSERVTFLDKIQSYDNINTLKSKLAKIEESKEKQRRIKEYVQQYKDSERLKTLKHALEYRLAHSPSPVNSTPRITKSKNLEEDIENLLEICTINSKKFNGNKPKTDRRKIFKRKLRSSNKNCTMRSYENLKDDYDCPIENIRREKSHQLITNGLREAMNNFSKFRNSLKPHDVQSLIKDIRLISNKGQPSDDLDKSFFIQKMAGSKEKQSFCLVKEIFPTLKLRSPSPVLKKEFERLKEKYDKTSATPISVNLKTSLKTKTNHIQRKKDILANQIRIPLKSKQILSTLNSQPPSPNSKAPFSLKSFPAFSPTPVGHLTPSNLQPLTTKISTGLKKPLKAEMKTGIDLKMYKGTMEKIKRKRNRLSFSQCFDRNFSRHRIDKIQSFIDILCFGCFVNQ
ncbi:unnamed protein product [Moneuplotes crassus]|uniref:Uncharacterized protein n=1 Tax=Euplotes crassus TaxID=5936 RepID=A0AAD1U2I7_EUPCR|nr:unnamed protein product [Moneuplotes crassus]